MSKIIIVSRSFAGGGAERIMVNYANGLHHLGHEVIFVVADDSGPYRTELNTNIRLVALSVGKMRQAHKKLVEIFKQESADVVFSTITNVNLAVIRAHKSSKTKAKLIVREAGFTSIQTSQQPIHVRLLLSLAIRRYYKLCDLIAVPAKDMLADLSDHFGIKPKLIRYLQSPIITPDISSLAAQKTGNASIDEGQNPFVLAVGRFYFPKDFATIMKAFARLGGNYYLVLLGDGPDKAKLEGLALELGIKDRVIFAGFVQNPFAYFARASLYVLSSNNEGMPNTLVQALALGCPSVASDCRSGPREILEGGKFGELFGVGDAEACFVAMQKTLQNPPSKVLLIDRASHWSQAQACETLLRQ